MATVVITAEALEQYQSLPLRIKDRVTNLFERLQSWPNVSGAKPLRGRLAGHYRVRTGDYRVQFHVRGDTVLVKKIGHRGGFYNEKR